jgi:hypothetical protein
MSNVGTGLKCAAGVQGVLYCTTRDGTTRGEKMCRVRAIPLTAALRQEVIPEKIDEIVYEGIGDDIV